MPKEKARIPSRFFFHGLPGNENNFDLAHAVRRAGWNSLHFHYRGAWGSEGAFSLAHVLEDARAAIAFARSPAARAARCDGDKIALIGHSTGAFAALFAASEDPHLLGAASLAGFNFGVLGHQLRANEALRTAWQQAFSAAMIALKGLTADALIAEIMAGAERYQLEGLAPKLVRTKLLLAWCSADTISEPAHHHHPLEQALREARHAIADAAPLVDLRFETDHYFFRPAAGARDETHRLASRIAMKRIWHTETTTAELNRWSEQTLLAHLGIRATEIGDDFLRAEMPVDHRTKQPAGLLHGGASVALAESLASVAGNLVVDPARFHCVGLEINANHLSACTEGTVVGTTRALHLGRTTQVWETRIQQGERLVCISRMTLAVVGKKPA